MLKFTAEIPEHNMRNMALEIELVSQLIVEGKKEGRGWKIEGFDEKEISPEITECFHVCTSNCRREGCNCECGEYHNLKE